MCNVLCLMSSALHETLAKVLTCTTNVMYGVGQLCGTKESVIHIKGYILDSFSIHAQHIIVCTCMCQ